MTVCDKGKMFLRDVKIDIFRQPNCGVNEHSNACRVTHKPTGTAITLYKYKALKKNKNVALKALYELVKD